jgi:protein arginine N-methyltransferase 5
VDIWRLWDGGGGKGKGKVWYEWCAEVYLPMPFGGGGGGGIGSGGGGGAGSPMVGGRNGVGAGQPLASPMMDAPFSPGGGSVWGVQSDASGRVKIGGTTLHNPAGIHSWVGL